MADNIYSLPRVKPWDFFCIIKKSRQKSAPIMYIWFIEIPTKMSVSIFMGHLKGKSGLIFHERHGNLRFKYGNRSFWRRGYYVDKVGRNAKRIPEYKKQLKEDQISDHMTLSVPVSVPDMRDTMPRS